ncbi:MAG: efflux RND transporter periplasmic adaptor subunit [Cyclobacteriaceae bacterium]|nr:efflux RND transporter periplasmic adaptor subunit [Cyclobacteriaceae bacterium]
MNLIAKLSLCLFIVLMACSSSDKPAADAATHEANGVTLSAEQFKLLDIKLGTPEKKIMSGVINANGMLDVPPQNMVTISAPLGGFVKSTDILQGMRVKKGQTIVMMEHPDYIQLQEDYLLNKNQLEFLELEYNRQQELVKENVSAAKSLQLAKSNYLSTKTKVQGMSAKLKLIGINPTELETGEIKNTITIASPISGFVTQVNVNIGMHVSPTDILFKIVDTEHLHAEAMVFEKDLPNLKIGQRVRVMLSNENAERMATVFLVGKEISPDRTVRVHCHFEKEDPGLIPGLYFKALIETEASEHLVLPSTAVVAYNNQHFVFVEKDSLHYLMVQVQVGKSQSDFTEVILPAELVQAKMVINGTYSLLSILKNTEE